VHKTPTERWQDQTVIPPTLTLTTVVHHAGGSGGRRRGSRAGCRGDGRRRGIEALVSHIEEIEEEAAVSLADAVAREGETCGEREHSEVIWAERDNDVGEAAQRARKRQRRACI
jgi:hypothetical protein